MIEIPICTVVVPASLSPSGGASASAPPGAFRVSCPELPPRAGTAASTVRAASLASSLLLFQELRDDERDDRNGREQATALLAALRTLQRAALCEANPEAAAAVLRSLLEGASSARDPRLRELLRSVCLRARIELQRLSVPGIG